MGNLTLTLKQVLALNEGLNKLVALSSKEDSKIPAKISYRAARLTTIITSPIEKYNAERRKLFIKFGKENFVETDRLDKDGNKTKEMVGYYFESGDNQNKFNEEITELVEKEKVDIPENLRFRFSEIEDIGLSMQEFIYLESIITEDDISTKTK